MCYCDDCLHFEVCGLEGAGEPSMKFCADKMTGQGGAKSLNGTPDENKRIAIEKTETFIEHDILMDGTKVGTVELCPERNEISRLVIFEPYQNKGYGTRVVKTLSGQGYRSLWVRSDNPRAIHVYGKCGFRRGETHMFEMCQCRGK